MVLNVSSLNTHTFKHTLSQPASWFTFSLSGSVFRVWFRVYVLQKVFQVELMNQSSVKFLYIIVTDGYESFSEQLLCLIYQ